MRMKTSLCRALALLLVAFPLASCDMLTSAETRMQRAAASIAAGEYRPAVFELRRVLEDEPGNARARLLLAEAEFGAGEVEAAEADLNRAVEAGISPAQAAPLKARLQLAFGRFEMLLTQIDAGEIVLEEPERTLMRGRALIGLRKPEEARREFAAVLDRDPASLDARHGVAESRAQSGDIAGALADLAAITAEDPRQARSWLAQGSLLIQLGRFEEARDALAQAVANAKGRLEEPLELQAIAGQVDALVAMNQIDAAESLFKGLDKRAGQAPITRMLKARIAVARGDLGAAVQGLTELTNDLPSYLPARFMLGSALLAQGNLYQAERQFSRVVEGDPANSEARKRLAEVRLRMNRPESAIDLLGASIGDGAGDPRAIALLGAAQLGAGADPSAIPRLEELVRASPDNRAARLDLAGLYISAGDAGRAVELLQAMPAVESDARRDVLLIRALAATRGPELARAEVERMIAASPQDVQRLNLAAGLQLSLGDVATATATLEKAIAVAPGDAATLVNLGRARLASQRLDEAEALFRRALSHDAASVDARVGMAEVAGRRGRNEEAIRWLEEIRVGDARAIASRLLLARLYLSSKETAKAARVLTEALAAAPNRADVLIAAGRLQQDFGQYEQALGYFRKAADLEPRQASHWLHVSLAQLALGHQVAARESVDRALALDRDSVEATALAVRLDAADGSPQAGLARALELRKRLPGDARAALLEGDIRASLGQHGEAARAFGESLRLERTLTAAVRLAQARQQAGIGDPRGPLRDWLRDHPDDLPARAMHAIFLDQAGNADLAIAEYERVLAAGTPDAVMSNNLAVRYLEKGDPRAESLARQAYRLAPTNAAIADTLGWILVKKGSRDEGLRLLREAAAQAPQEPEILLHLAEALVESGQPGEARALLDRLIAAHPEFSGRRRAEELRTAVGG